MMASEKSITKTRLFKYIENFTTKKTKSFQIKILIFFHISAQNIDCGYSLEPPRRGGFKEYPQYMFLSGNMKNNIYPCKPQFSYIKVGFKGVKTIQACFRDEGKEWIYIQESQPYPLISGGISCIFFSPWWKYMLWVFIRNASPRCFLWVPTTYIFTQK